MAVHNALTCCRTRGARLCKEKMDGCGFRASAATSLDSEDHKVAARRARRLGDRCRDVCAMLRAEERSRVESRPPCCSSPWRVTGLTQAVSTASWAPSGDSSLERNSGTAAGSQGAGVGTCCSMVAEQVKHGQAATACTDSRGEWHSEQEHGTLRRDGDCFVCQAGREAARGVRPSHGTAATPEMQGARWRNASRTCAGHRHGRRAAANLEGDCPAEPQAWGAASAWRRWAWIAGEVCEPRSLVGSMAVSSSRA
eukprot:s3758_g8.t1